MASSNFKSFLYNFRDQRMFEEYTSLDSIGYEYRQDPSQYNIDCKSDVEQKCIFQYTVSGMGALIYDKQIYQIKPGQAFLIERPGPFKYYLPKTSNHWELKFLAVGLSSLKMWNDITQSYGRVITLGEKSSVMEYWDYIFELALKDELNNFFMSSSYAYTFMMCLHDTLRKQANNKLPNDIVQTCIHIIKTQYQDDITLEYLANICSVSPSLLSKKFKEANGISIIQYLINYRIKMACSLLIRSHSSIEDIALKVGFKEANYFSRMFRKMMNVSPKEFRIIECTKVVEETGSQHITLEIPPFE